MYRIIMPEGRQGDIYILYEEKQTFLKGNLGIPFNQFWEPRQKDFKKVYDFLLRKDGNVNLNWLTA